MEPPLHVSNAKDSATRHDASICGISFSADERVRKGRLILKGWRTCRPGFSAAGTGRDAQFRPTLKLISIFIGIDQSLVTCVGINPMRCTYIIHVGRYHVAAASGL